MSAGTPKITIPRTIDPRRFAQLGVVLQGDVPVSELTRLPAAGVEVASVSARLVFALGEHREKCLSGDIRAAVSLQCQRCLEPVQQDRHCAINLVVVWDEEAAKQVGSDRDPWVVDTDDTDLYSLIEEEILLDLPLVATHDYDCADMAHLNPDGEASADTESRNPFQVLMQLKEKNLK